MEIWIYKNMDAINANKLLIETLLIVSFSKYLFLYLFNCFTYITNSLGLQTLPTAPKN